MKFGQRLYRIASRRHAVALSLLAAVIACTCTLYRPSLLPPGLHSRALQIGAASTEILVATPNVVVGGPTDYLSLVNRATLVGNVMVSGPVLASVGHAVGVAPERIQATAPMTANVPQALIQPGSGGNATNIIASPDRYKLEIQADPSVPILHVYAQAPSKDGAIRLATAAVQGLTTYLKDTQAAGKVAPAQQVRIQQLGPVQGGIANPGAPMQIAILVFVGVFGLSLWVIGIVAQIRRGWSTARLAEQV